jgi:HEPN domain-containing protein
MRKSLSDNDLKTAGVLFNGECYLYAGFMCHLTIEKIFKACYVKIKGDTPPFTHDLLYLAAKSGFDNLFTEEQQDFITKLTRLTLRLAIPNIKAVWRKH